MSETPRSLPAFNFGSTAAAGSAGAPDQPVTSSSGTSGGLFGQVAPGTTDNKSNNLFKNSATPASGTANPFNFGGTGQSQSIFGATSGSSTSAGQPTTSASGQTPLFGGVSDTSNTGGGLFGNVVNTQKSSGGLFGTPSAPATDK